MGILNKIRESFRNYCKRNVEAYNRREGRGNSVYGVEYSIEPLPNELRAELKEHIEGEFCTLEMLNDDITPMEYVIRVLEVCFEKNTTMASELMFQVHNKGSAQIIAGNREALKKVIEHIENDARRRKFPLKLVLNEV